MNKFSELAEYNFGNLQKKLAYFFGMAADFCHLKGIWNVI